MGRHRKTQAISGKGGSQIRIIGGRWRGSKLEVIAQDQLRPSGDRVRETLFNWLGSSLIGIRCLDLFAGTGALGLEAVSRGAACALLIEKHAPSASALKARVSTLEDASMVEVLQADAFDWLERQSPETDTGCHDLIFLDPPFAEPDYQALLEKVRPLLANGGRLYLETAVTRSVALPDWLMVLKQKTQGQVAMTLSQRVQ